MGKRAEPAGLIVKCPYCGKNTEIERRELMQNEVPCSWSDCGEYFSTPEEGDFIDYINGKHA